MPNAFFRVQRISTGGVTPPTYATQYTLSLSATTGETGSSITVTVTPNNTIQTTNTVTIGLSGGGTLGTTTLSFTAGSSAAQSTTLTRSTDGTSTVSITNNGGLSNSGTPATYTSSTTTFAGGVVLLTLAGQSNADGRGLITDLSTSPLSSDPGLATYGAAAFSRVYIWNGSAFAQLLLGSNNGGVNPAPGSGTQFGPEFGIAVRWMRETSSGTLYIVKNGASGASITGFAPASGFNQYQILESAHTAAASALSGAGVTVTNRAFVWNQGESDTGQTQSWYQTRLQDILTASYANGWFTSTQQQVLFQVGTTSTFYDTNVAAAKTAIAATAPTYIKTQASPNYWDGSGYHQNARGQVQMGYDAFSLIFNRPTITV